MTAAEKATSWLNQNIDTQFKSEIQAMLKGEADLEDAFHKDLEFGTGGMRGVMGVGSNRINKYTLGMATQGLCDYVNRQFPNSNNRIAIAYDCRNNSAKFAKLVADIITANGLEAYLFSDLRPTPELSFAVRRHNCQAGIVITASHNPPEYNGYKVYWDDGAQIVAPHDAEIIKAVRAVNISEIKFEGNPTLIKIIDETTDTAFLQASLSQRRTAHTHPLKIVFTPLHGTSITLLPQLLKLAGYEDVHIVEEQAVPDGNFSTVKSPNPEERAALQMALKKADEINADLVVGTDPDSDRLGVAVRDESGHMQLLNGNQCGALLTEYLLKNSNLNGSEFIAYTIVSSDLFADIASHYNINSEVCLTGFKHIASLIRKHEGKHTFIGGGEESYGYMVGDFVRDKDALTSTLIFADLAAEAKHRGSNAFQDLCGIYKREGLYYEHLVSITKKGIEGADEVKTMMARFRENPPTALAEDKVVRIDDLMQSTSRDLPGQTQKEIFLPKSNALQFFTEKGSKISVRPSGTEPKIKLYFSLKTDWDSQKTYSEQIMGLKKQINLMIDTLMSS